MCSSDELLGETSKKSICLELLSQMNVACERIIRRGTSIVSPLDFTASEEGIDAMDGIIIMVIVLGEAVKKLERAAPVGSFLRNPEIDWTGMKGMRNVLSHEYFGVNPETLFDVTKNKIPELLKNLQIVKKDVETNL